MSSQTTLQLHNASGNIQRRTANYHPTLWGDYFLDYQLVPTEKSEKYEELKVEVSKMLKLDNLCAKPIKERLVTIEAIKRLGIEYHFKQEIESVVKNILDNGDDNEDDDLSTVAIRFRILREHGYNVPSDIFNKFKDEKGDFKEEIGKDITGLLNLYEASNLRMHGEDILDEGLAFTTTTLEAFLQSNLDPIMAKKVESALWRPIRKAIPRLAAREFISFYQENEDRDDILLTFAKLDFNLVMKQHQKELRLISKWWKDLEVEKNFPYARDRIAEGYLWGLGVFYEPQYSLGRWFVTKVLNICSILDDTFDAYGTKEELELFTNAFAWSQQSAMENLPPYMKMLCQAIKELFDEMEKEMAKEGRPVVCYVKETMKNLVKAYLEESRLLHKMPSLEEYMKSSLVTTCYPLLSATSFLGLGEMATKEAFDWLMSGPSILHASCIVCRFMDDIVSHQFEREREHIPSAVECYMNEYGVSEEIACKELNKQVEDAWKDTNESLVDPNAPPIPLQTCVMNLTRMIDLVYKEDDGYTRSYNIKHYIASLLVHEFQV